MEYLTYELFSSDLFEGEKIQWVGQPEPQVLFTHSDIYLVPFSLLWGGFAIFWEILAWESRSFALCLGLPLFLIGLYFLFGRFLYKIWKKKHTYYAVTDRRVLVLTKKLFSRDVRAAYIDKIVNMSKSVRSDGIGTILFGNPSYWGSVYANTGLEFFGSFYGREVPTFYDIKDANQVFRLVNGIRIGEEPEEF